ncbi:hypothetical protein [Georgenia sp. SYP-B2076]|uniref:restriction system modified-DNA reader domain-containing protein n=1 Tax=Georgenia sp. SYP-B2076 TaxID=2495881 RepID=UPI000F8D5044|nr:hypothetical protein [Georgenia sp. SYP-B2076]
MPFFEFDEGRLVPAQFGRPVADEVEPEIFQAVRDQVLEVVQHPLFPVSWHGDGRRPGSYRDAAAPAPRLTAMDASGQVVTVEVIETLDSAALVAALSRSARNAELGWTQLSDLYPQGVAAFRRDWNIFRESMPPRSEPGPRLILVASAVADEVRPALDALVGSGVEVHEMALRQMTNGRRFLEVTELTQQRLRLATVLTGRTVEHAELGGGPDAVTQVMTVVPASTVDAALTATSGAQDAQPTNPDAHSTPPPTPDVDEPAADEPAADEPAAGVRVARRGHRDAVAPPEAAADAPAHAHADAPVVVTSAEARPAPTQGAPADGGAPAPNATAHADGTRPGEAPAPAPSDELRIVGLAQIARALGGDTPLLWSQLRRGIRHEATLTAAGALVLGDGSTFEDPDAAATAASGRVDVDGWRVWRFGEAGPSLADARSELTAAAGRPAEPRASAGGPARRSYAR